MLKQFFTYFRSKQNYKDEIKYPKKNFDCRKIIANDSEEIARAQSIKRREIPKVDGYLYFSKNTSHKNLFSSTITKCEQVKLNNYPETLEERQNPLAFAIVMFMIPEQTMVKNF